MNLRKRHTVVLLSAILIALTASLVVMLRTGVFGSGSGQDDFAILRAELLRKGQKEYQKLDMVPITSLPTVEDTRSLLEAVDFSSDTKLDTTSKSSLIDTLADFIYYRFVQPDVNAYMKWRTDQGYTFRSRDDLIQLAGIDAVYRQATGEEPGNLSVDDMFRRVYAIATPDTHSPWSVQAIAKDDFGLCASVGHMSAGNLDRKPIEGKLPADLWRGRVWGAVPNWYQRGPLALQLVQTHDSVLYADIGLIIEFSNGVRRPIVCTFIREPTTGRWRLEYLMDYNYPLEELCPLAY